MRAIRLDGCLAEPRRIIIGSLGKCKAASGQTQIVDPVRLLICFVNQSPHTDSDFSQGARRRRAYPAAMLPSELSLPAALHLVAVDVSRNIARAYTILVDRDLFDHWLVETRWGRIGSRGRASIRSFAFEDDARTFVRSTLTRRASARKRIGVAYQAVAELPSRNP